MSLEQNTRTNILQEAAYGRVVRHAKKEAGRRLRSESAVRRIDAHEQHILKLQFVEQEVRRIIRSN